MRLFLLLGANLGDRFEALKQARLLLAETVGKLINESNEYETPPWGVVDQPPYLNQVLEIDTMLSPIAVLDQAQAIEHRLGRVRRERWGARLIDIDLLYYDNLVLQTPRLTLPHPLLHERAFTLVPLCDIAPDFVHPVLKKTNEELLSNLNRDYANLTDQP